VEQIKPIDFAIAKRFFSSTEYDDLMEKEEHERLNYFYDLWTLKESYIKARGKGLSIPLDSFSIRKHNTTITVTSNRDESWYFIQYPIGPEYKFSVCATTLHFPMDIEYLNPGELAEQIPVL
jgi:4'-phosphopantetheinyl transferase